MTRLNWARASQFNWVFDNLGGVPLMAAVAGNLDQAYTLVQADGTVRVEDPLPGGGKVVFVRGVWRRETTFCWDGFWADPLEGDLTNYYSGGSFGHQGEATVLNLGVPLTPGTPVQVFYLYYTGERAQKYEALNNYPCIRRAWRSREDFTYDFAVDRMLDLMVYLHLAEKERGQDFQSACRFLWEAFVARQASLTPPLLYDSFERDLWDRGAYFLYRHDTRGGAAFQVFAPELAPGETGRALHVRTELPAQKDGAWWGYGLNWSLIQEPFVRLDRVGFRLKGQAASRQVHQLAKSGSGRATLILSGDYTPQERRYFVIEMETGGDVGQATFRWSRDGGLTWEAGGVVTGDRDHPVDLFGGLAVSWESGGAPDFVAGDYWTFWAGPPQEHPRRLLVVLNDASPGDPDPFGPAHQYVHAIPDRFEGFNSFEIPFSQFWRRDNLIDDGDRVRATWGTWYAASQQGDVAIWVTDREETEVIFGDTYYTQRQVTWDLSPYVTAFGVWVGIDPNLCQSNGHTEVNFLVKPLVEGASSLTLRVKVKDAQGTYFYQDQNVAVGSWQRVTVNLAEMLPLSESQPLTHPLQVLDIGIASTPPSNGTLLLTDLKFGDHQTFEGAAHLRLLEFKCEQQHLPEHEWWLDDVTLPLMSEDPYPLAPRLAISLTPYGQNPWRGPTLVHYVQPLGPYLAGALDISQTYVKLHRDAQEEYHRRFGGVKGPVLPVHTRNDLENIALCGEENFGRFCWWPKYRDFGQTVGFWLFNGTLTDASGRGHNLTYEPEGTPSYTAGLCQPGDTALVFDGNGGHPCFSPGTGFLLGNQDFTLEVVAKFANLTGTMTLVSLWAETAQQRSWAFYREGPALALAYSTTGQDRHTVLGSPCLENTESFYHLVVTRAGGRISFYVNGQGAGGGEVGSVAFYPGSAVLRLGRAEGSFPGNFAGALDLVAIRIGRALPAEEVAARWRILRGWENGSAYPEVGSGLGQYWAFMRLAQYYFVSGDPEAWPVLESWLTWIDTHGAPEGNGWKFPVWFSEYGFSYGDYDPGQTSAIALGCLYIYLRNGHGNAALWARRILDDLRLCRQSQEFGGGYKSDRHYAWLNALVIQAFGVAAFGLPGQAYVFPALPEDAAHFEALMNWLFQHAGEAKPNLLNADLIPFMYLEDDDQWEYAPHYLAMSAMGSLEAVVLMLGAALAYGRGRGDWTWFDRLWQFILQDNRAVLEPWQLKRLAVAYQMAGLKNVVRVYFADYDQNNTRFCEVRDEQAVAAWGVAAADLDLRYGSPVILESPEVAELLAARLLKRLSTPWELVTLETWLEGARLEIGDTLAVTSPFHGFREEEFTVFGKAVDLARRRVTLEAARPLGPPPAWASDSAGGNSEAFAITQDHPRDPDWEYRSYAG